MAPVLRAGELPSRDRGGGVRSTFLVAPGTSAFASGITELDPGSALALHAHDCDESVLVLDGDATYDEAGATHALGRGDATLVPAGVLHRFANRSAAPLRILFVYGASRPTRTLASGETLVVGEEPAS